MKSLEHLNEQLAALTRELAETNDKLRLEVAARDCAEQQLILSGRRRDEFLATLAHELRNPLAPIQHSLKLLDATGLDEAKRQWSSQVIARQVQRMALILDDLLDVSRITRGRLELKRASVDLTALIAAAVETATPLIAAKQHTFTVDLPKEPVTVEVDALRMSQAVANLLINAAQYTPPGGHIGLAVDLVSDALRIAVKDTGVGFEPSAILAMFDMFTVVSRAGSRFEGGLGIGLSLVKSLITLHDGTVEASSAGAGRGAQFMIRLPRSIIVSPVATRVRHGPSVAAADEARCRVLVIDDNRDSADTLALVLQCSGLDVQVGYSGWQALELGRHGRPDAMILDIGLPDMTGYEVARRLRLEPWGQDLLLVAMTGWGQATDKERAREAGFDRHLTKPIDSSELERILSAFMEGRDAPIPT